MNSILLNKHSLNVAKMACKKEYNLNAILVTDKETCATNGHYLIRVSHNESMNPREFPTIPGDAPTVKTKHLLMHRDAALETIKALPKKSSIPILEYAKVGKDADGNIRATATDLETHRQMSFRAIEGRFPNWEAVIVPDRTREPRVTFCVNAKYLSELAKAASEFNDFMTIRVWDEQSAIRMDTKDTSTNQEWNCVLMPARGRSGKEFAYDVEIPDPFKDVPEPEEPETVEV